jgi:hypothetical protein
MRSAVSMESVAGHTTSGSPSTEAWRPVTLEAHLFGNEPNAGCLVAA